MSTKKLKSCRYLIIGGTTKAATTSLFFYLKEHPEVCTANWKESRFFLDDDYPLKSKYRFKDGLEKYETFYSHCTGNRLRVEATPDYLYSVGTACKIKSSLPRAKMLFVLRDPISRLVSWYRFAKQNGDIPNNMTFDTYVEILAKAEGEKGRKQHMLALEQGQYSLFLKPYIKTFGSDRIKVIFYETFSSAQPRILESICVFAGIDATFFKDFDFKIYNKTETMRSPLMHKAYIGIRFHVRRFTYNRPLVHGAFSKLRQLFESVYLGLNTKSFEKVGILPTTQQFLQDYYGKESILLKELLGREIPW